MKVPVDNIIPLAILDSWRHKKEVTNTIWPVADCDPAKPGTSSESTEIGNEWRRL